MSAQLPKLDGHFDGIVDNQACGWVYSADAPRTRLEVELVSDDQIIARGIANCFRQSLLEAGIGDGKHAFSIALPSSVRDGELHNLAVREAYTGQILDGGAKRFHAQAAEQAPPAPASSELPTQQDVGLVTEATVSQVSAAPATAFQVQHRGHSLSVQGGFDQIIDGRARGWVFSPDAPGTRLEVEILCGEQVVARGLANVERPDLARSGYGDGRHGFDLPIDLNRCQESPALLSAREAFSGQALPGSPQPLDPGRVGTISPSARPEPAPSSVQPDMSQPIGVQPTEPPSERAQQPNLIVPPSGPMANEAVSGVRTEVLAEPLKVHGHFDDLLNGNADGWVFFPEQPQRRADVEALCDGRVVARGKADRLRADLQEAGIADGHCAFSLPIDPFLFDGQRHQIVVRELRTGQILDGSPKVLSQEARGTLREPLASRPQAAGAYAPLRMSAPEQNEPAPPAIALEQTSGVTRHSNGGKATMSTSLKGRLEAVRNGHLEGWALDPVDPARRLEVEVFCDGHLQGRCAADLYREDLVAAGVGDGRHAFSLPLSASLLDNGQHSLMVRECHSGQLLEGSPLVLRLEASALAEPVSTMARPDHTEAEAKIDAESREQPLTEPSTGVTSALAAASTKACRLEQESQDPADGTESFATAVQVSAPVPEPEPELEPTSKPMLNEALPASEPELQGRFEGILNGQVAGWAIDPLRPEMRVELEILCDGEPVARTRADLEREDLAEVALGDGRHGFRLTLDAKLFDGKPHELSVRVLRTQQLLPGSPQRLQSEAPPARVRPADIQGAFEAISGTRAVGHAWDISRPDHRLEVEILCEGAVIGRAPANTFRRDLYESGIGDGRHAFSVPISYELFDAKPHWLTAREAHTGKSLTHGPHLFEEANAHWPFDLMPRSETLKQFDVLIAEPETASRAFDLEHCRSLLLDACLRQEMRQTEAARGFYRQLLEQLGENALCYCKLAETWLLDGEPDPALDAYRRASSLPSSLFWAYLGIGNAFKQRNQFVESEDAYQSALQISPRDPLVRKRLDEVRARAVPIRVDRLVADGQLDEGIRLLKTRLIEEPENPMILNKLSSLLRHYRDPEGGSSADEDDDVVAFDDSLRVLELLLADTDLQRRREGQA